MTKKPTPNKPRLQYSWTTVDIFENKCPYVCWLARVKKQKSNRPNPWRDRGSGAHEVIAAYNQHLVTKCLGQDLGALPEIAAKILHKRQDLPMMHHAAIREMCETTAVEQGEFDYLHVTGIEKFFSLKIGRFCFRGIRDVEFSVGKVGLIRDYKSSYRVRPQSEVDEDPQLRIYAWTMLQMNPALEAVMPELFFMPLGVVKRPSIAPWTREDLADVKGDLMATMEVIETKVAAVESGELKPHEAFEPREGAFCSMCDFADECPRLCELIESKDPRLDTLILSEEDAIRIAGDVLLLDRRRKDRMDALKEWSASHGSVVVGEKEFSHRKRARRTFDARTIARAVKALDRDPFDVLRIDSGALDEFTAAYGTPEFIQSVSASTENRHHSDYKPQNYKGETT